MNNESYFKKFLINTFTYALGSLFLGIPIFIYMLYEDYPLIALAIIIIFFAFVAQSTHEDIQKAKDIDFKEKLSESDNKAQTAQKELGVANHKEELAKQLLKERAFGFPTLFSNIDYYENLIDDSLAGKLETKSHPAFKAADTVKEESKRRRVAEKENRITQSIIEFYEKLEPSLIDYKNQEFGDLDEILQEWTQEESEDPVTYFLSKDEYRKLSVTEKNQLALNRYWTRPHSNWQVGIMYERYVGYLYEMNGYEVLYHGIKEGKRDLGRDVIAQKGNNLIVIQCKYWSQFKKIFENEIFQFFGTVFEYRFKEKSKNIQGIFYSTCEVSDLAKVFANELKIELQENFKMDKTYPCIKCNISRVDGTKIYHLPFDQQYDHTKIEPNRGEFYASTVVEAEEKGFRRAWRWKGTAKD